MYLNGEDVPLMNAAGALSGVVWSYRSGKKLFCSCWSKRWVRTLLRVVRIPLVGSRIVRGEVCRRVCIFIVHELHKANALC